jgi:hypothetical protein
MTGITYKPRRPGRHAAGITYTLVALLVLLAVGTVAVYAQGGSGYDLTWHTVDNGGVTRHTASGGGYTLGGTAGQPDAATWSGGDYTLSGGFWHAAVVGGTPPGGSTVYLPVILKNR